MREGTYCGSYSAWKLWSPVPSPQVVIELFGHVFSAPCLDERRCKLINYFEIPERAMESALTQTMRLEGDKSPLFWRWVSAENWKIRTLCPHRLFPYAAL